jgi:hypothetical protein
MKLQFDANQDFQFDAIDNKLQSRFNPFACPATCLPAPVCLRQGPSHSFGGGPGVVLNRFWFRTKSEARLRQ